MVSINLKTSFHIILISLLVIFLTYKVLVVHFNVYCILFYLIIYFTNIYNSILVRLEVRLVRLAELCTGSFVDVLTDQIF